MNDKLNFSESSLLREIIMKHNDSLINILDSIGQSKLTTEERENLRELIADELIETGLDENDEPNKRGLMLEKLIDMLANF